PAWLFLGLRSRRDFAFDAELAPPVRAGRLEVNVALSRDDATMVFDPGEGRFVPEPAARRRVPDLLLQEETAQTLWELIRRRDEGGAGACIYVCGRSHFARSSLDAITALLRRFAAGDDEGREAVARQMLRELMAEG